MQRLSSVIRLVLLLAMLLPLAVSAQTSSVNAYSPYSMYGPGELLTPGSVVARSMGGVGIAQRYIGRINMLNPAGASVITQKSFLFDVAFDATHYRNNQPKFSVAGDMMYKAKTAYNTINIHNIAIAFPLAKRVGATVTVAPYSSVGYKVATTDQNDDTWADIGRVVYGYEGEGDITEVKLSIGWAPWQNLSIGVAAKYYWGYIQRNYTTEVKNMITGGGNYASTKGVDNYVVSNFKFQAGIQWNIISNDERVFTLGATYDLGGYLNPKLQSYVYTDNVVNKVYSSPVRDRMERVELKVPHKVGVGVFYRDRVVAWGADYNYENWGASNRNFVEDTSIRGVVVAYTNTHNIRVGFELTPRRSDVRNYLNRMSYRLGASVGNYYQTFAGQHINKLAITAGLGFPVKVWGASSINVGFEYGRMFSPKTPEISGAKIGLVTQNYYKISIGFSLFSADTSDYWFVRQKYD